MLKELIKRFTPSFILTFRKKVLTIKALKKAYIYDYKRFLNYSASLNKESEPAILGNIIRTYHVVEKGLTMPNMKKGFGYSKILYLIEQLNLFIELYGVKDDQLSNAVGVLNEYVEIHESIGFYLDKDIVEKIKNITDVIGFVKSQQLEFFNETYFEKNNSDFKSFSNSRHSVRNYSNIPIDLEKIKNSLFIAENTPSACNRQCWRTIVVSNKKKIRDILEVQGGSRGFNHLVDKLIIIMGEIGLFDTQAERNQVYVDGGIYTMNLLYALHYNEIGCCVLNCSNSVTKDLKLRTICNVKESEVFIAMISCGNLPNKFKVATSPRYSYKKTTTFI